MITKKTDDFKELSIIVPAEGTLPIVQKSSFLPIGVNEIRVKMITMGYCGRDKSIVSGQKGAKVGRIGHEGAGIIVEKGTEVKHLAIGQNVIIFPFIRNHNIGYDWPDGGKGIFSNYPVIPSEAVYIVNKHNVSCQDWLSYSLIEPFAGVARGLRRAEVVKKDLLIILGAGPIGCEQVILAKYLNPSIKIVLIDVLIEKIRLSKQIKIPADYFLHFDSAEEIQNKISKISLGIDNILIIHSNPFKKSIKQALRIAPDRSTILFFSGVYDWDENDNQELGLSINPKRMHYEEYDENIPEIAEYHGKTIKLIGSRGFSKADFDYIANLIIDKKVEPLSLITKVLKFDEKILHKLKIEGEKKNNMKILMSPLNEYLNI